MRLSKIFQKYLFACVCGLSCFRLFTTPWTVAHQAPLSMGFPRQDYWSGLPFPLPGDLPKPGIKPSLLCLPHCRQIVFLSHQRSLISLLSHQRSLIYLLIYYSLPPSLSSFSPFCSPSFFALSKSASQTKNLFFWLFFFFFFWSLAQGFTSFVHLLCIIYLFPVKCRFHECRDFCLIIPYCHSSAWHRIVIFQQIFA